MSQTFAHTTVMLNPAIEQLLGPADGEPLRLVSIAFPLKDAAGQTAGVLGVQISWKWAGEIRDAIFGPVTRHRAVELLIVSNTGNRCRQRLIKQPYSTQIHRINIQRPAQFAGFGQGVQRGDNGIQYAM